MPRSSMHRRLRRIKEKKRDPEMHQTRKGNQWYFGMKIHIGTDANSNMIHSAAVTAAAHHDSRE